MKIFENVFINGSRKCLLAEGQLNKKGFMIDQTEYWEFNEVLIPYQDEKMKDQLVDMITDSDNLQDSKLFIVLKTDENDKAKLYIENLDLYDLELNEKELSYLQEQMRSLLSA